MSKVFALLALAALGAPAFAQAPPQNRQVRIDVSPAGQAVIKKFLGTRDPAIVQQMGQLQSLAQRMVALSNAPQLDLARLQALMRQQEGIEAAIRRRGNDRMIAMLTALSPADRVKFVRSMRGAQPAAK